MPQLLFVVAELFGAIRAGKRVVALLAKAFGVSAVKIFPLEKKNERESEKRPRINVGYVDERCEHHSVIPVINTAGGTAFVLHKPRLKRAEKQNADYVAHRVQKRNQEQNTPIYYVGVVKNAEHGVESDPRGKYREGYYTGLHFRALLGIFPRARSVISRKLLLTAHAFNFIGKEAQNHFCDEKQPYNAYQNMIVLKSAEGLPRVINAVYDIHDRCRNKKSQTKKKLRIMHNYGACQMLTLLFFLFIYCTSQFLFLTYPRDAYVICIFFIIPYKI